MPLRISAHCMHGCESYTVCVHVFGVKYAYRLFSYVAVHCVYVLATVAHVML